MAQSVIVNNKLPNGTIIYGVKSGNRVNTPISNPYVPPQENKNISVKSIRRVEYMPQNAQRELHDVVVPSSPEMNHHLKPVKLVAVDPADNKSDPPIKKKSSGRRKKKSSSRRPDPKIFETKPKSSPRYILESPDRKEEEVLSPRSSRRRGAKQSSSRKTQTILSDPFVKQVPLNPKSNRRASSSKRSSPSRSKKKTSNTPLTPVNKTTSGNTHYENVSIIAPKSSPPSSAPKSSRRGRSTVYQPSSSSSDGSQPQITVDGVLISSGTLREAMHEEEEPVEFSQRRRLKARKKALDKNLEDAKDENGELSGTEEGNIQSAIFMALQASREEAEKEAKLKGEPFRAAVLANVNRPDDITSVIDKLVSDRRKEIKEESARSARREAINRKKTNSKSRKRPSSRKKPVSVHKSVPKSGPKSEAKSDLRSEDLFGDDPLIETMDEEPSSLREPSPRKSRRHKVSKQREPANIEICKGYAEVYEESEDDFAVEDERDVPIPTGFRKARNTDNLGPADALGQRENIYDPLNADRELEVKNFVDGDNIYEESDEEDDIMTIDEKKDEMIYRFKLIQEAYPGIALPRITKKMKLAKIVRHYEFVESRLKLKIKTKNFRIVLVLGFLATQFGVKWLTGVNTAGFTYNQMKCIGQYEKYLREFGESDWSSIGENMPLYIRLPFAVCVNFAIFMAAKFAMKHTGKDYTSEFHKLYGELTGDNSYNYLNEKDTSAGLDAGEEGGNPGGMFGMIQKVMGMFGGGEGGGGGGLAGMFGGGGGESRPARGTAGGPTYERKRRPRNN